MDLIEQKHEDLEEEEEMKRKAAEDGFSVREFSNILLFPPR